MYQTDAYSATFQPSDEKSTLQKEVEDNETILIEVCQFSGNNIISEGI